jgi:2-polyprenyl-6-methoxyphenol hydroxylase-like FAD-dependent oxidoreductase
MQNSSVAIIGSDITGHTLALMLAKIGFKIDVFDYIESEEERSEVLLSVRGLKALNFAHIETSNLS